MFFGQMACNTLSYTSDLQLHSTADYYPFGMVMPGRQFQSGNGYRFGYQGSEKDDEIAGSGNSYTSHFRQLDVRLARWWGIDPKASSMPWQSPYMAMDGNPILFTDQLGDSSKYFNSKGDLLLTTHDNLENGVFSIPDENLLQFEMTLNSAEKEGQGPLSNEAFFSDSELNSKLRSFGTGYAVDGFKRFFDENKGDITENGLVNEHKTFLYEYDGLVRVGPENIAGDPDIVAGGSPLGNNSVGKAHTHPNAGKSKGFGSTYTHRPSKSDRYRKPYKTSRIHDVVISDKYIYFINHRNYENQFAIPVRNTFDDRKQPANVNPWAE